jgi:hypothetical protein
MTLVSCSLYQFTTACANQQLVGKIDTHAVHVLHKRHAGMAAEITRERTHALTRYLCQIRFTQIRREILADEGKRVADAGCGKSCWIRLIGGTSQKFGILITRQNFEHRHEKYDLA